ncbi:hypothetical protein FBUS_07125 [Fasciolopsis buskii]|uniref:G-protein coupled receptors family 1 profile domain-containing protein n=1 Tax=Fasciolopsis buskii TaxID=27845 RepID=A0A8E0VKR3_9TREM|nr:hypothetical protein FBUS_07125 [Fasciolopsis buski]
MAKTVTEVSDVSLVWFIIVLITFAFGVLLNLALLFILVRFRKSTESLITTGILQTVIDWIVCILSVIHLCSVHIDIEHTVTAIILCCLIFSNAILWGLVAIRWNLSLLTAFFYFIQFMYPFMRIEQQKKPMNLSMCILLTLCSLLGIAPHIFGVRYEADTGMCIRDVGENLLVPSRKLIVLRLVILLGFVYNFLVPFGTGVYLYRHVLKVLRIRDKSQHAAAYKEMRLNAMQDVWLQAAFSFPAVCIMFLHKYPNADWIRIPANIQFFAIFLLCGYSVIYPGASVLFRRKYRKPVLDCLIQMGMHPTDSWLAQRWSIGPSDRGKSSYHSLTGRRATRSARMTRLQ